jgi:hypothetical protein
LKKRWQTDINFICIYISKENQNNKERKIVKETINMKEGQDNKKKNMKKIDKDTIMINKIINKSIMEKDNRSRDKKDQNNNKKVKRFILSKIILK